MSLLALAAAHLHAQAADITITGARAYDGTMAGAGLIIDGSAAKLTIPSGVTIGTLVDLRNGGTVDNAGTIARTGSGNRGVVGGIGTVISRDGGQITSADGTGVLLYESGTVTNTGTGSLIRGGFRGVSIQGGTGSISNTGGATIESTGEIGIYIGSTAAPGTAGLVTITNDATSTIRGASTGIRVVYDDDNRGTLTVSNSGTITALNGDGISLQDGTVDNWGASALIDATDVGIFLDGSGEVTNRDGARIRSAGDGINMYWGGDVANTGGGAIDAGGIGIIVWDYGTVTNTGSSIAGGHIGIDMQPYLQDGPFEVVNQGAATIDGGYAGVRFAGTGKVTSTGAGSTISADTYAIYYESEAGDVINSDGARITSRDGSGVAFSAGGTFKNLGGAKVDAKVAGVYSVGGATQVVNSGTGTVIAGSAQGIFTDAGLTLTNGSGGTIQSGEIGVYIGSGGGSITNEAGAKIAGSSAIHAFGNTTLVNQGRLEGKVLLERTALNTVTLHAGSVITGDLEIGDHSSSSLTLTGTGSQLYSEAVLGSTSFASKLVKKGSGTWIVDKAIDATIVNIDEGTLIIGVGGNGEVVGTVNVNPGSRLTGSGKVYGNVIVDNAVVAPGNSPGVLNIVGGYAPGAGSVFEAEIDPSNILSDRIDVTGGAVIGAGAELKVIRLSQAPYAVGTRYTVVTTTTGRSGTFTLTGDLNPSGFLGIDDEYDSHNVYLVVTQNRMLASAALTANQRAVAAALDAAGTGPARNAALNAADDAAARAAFDALSGEVHAALRGTLLLDAGRVGDAAIDVLRGDSTLWAKTLGGTGRVAGNGNGHEVLNTTGGFLFGGDLPVAAHLRLGLLAGIVGHGASVANSNATTTSSMLGLYGAAEFGDFAFRFGASTGFDDIHTSLTTALPGIGNTAAHYAGWTNATFAEAAYFIEFGPVTLEPFAGISLASLSTGGFAETGTGLTAASATSSLATSTIGLRASGVIDLGGSELELDGSLGWRHVIAGAPTTMTGSYDGASFTVTGAPLPADTLDVSVGGTLALSDSALLGLRYSSSFSANAASHAVTGSLKVSF